MSMKAIAGKRIDNAKTINLTTVWELVDLIKRLEKRINNEKELCLNIELLSARSFNLDAIDENTLAVKLVVMLELAFYNPDDVHWWEYSKREKLAEQRAREEERLEQWALDYVSD